MNLSQKCSCCLCEPVCKYKEIYRGGVESILDTLVYDRGRETVSFWKLKDCPHIEVSVKCPHMITRSAALGVTDKELAEKMKEVIKEGGDEEVWHVLADGLLCETLEKLGFSETVKAFDDIPKWYS